MVLKEFGILSMVTPNFIKKYRIEAEDNLRSGCVRDLVFSGGTYQVQLFDREEKRAFWAFLQLDDQGRVADCFCTCEDVVDSIECEGYIIYQNEDV